MPSFFTVLVASDDIALYNNVQQATQRIVADSVLIQVNSTHAIDRFIQRYRSLNVVVFDPRIELNWTVTLNDLLQRHPETRTLVVVQRETTSSIRRAEAHGAVGILSRHATIDAIEMLMRPLMERGHAPVERSRAKLEDPGSSHEALMRKAAELTPSQRRVLMLIADGYSNKLIAERLKVTVATVKAHTSAILKKLGVRSRTQAVLLAQRLQE